MLVVLGTATLTLDILLVPDDRQGRCKGCREVHRKPAWLLVLVTQGLESAAFPLSQSCPGSAGCQPKGWKFC